MPSKQKKPLEIQKVLDILLPEGDLAKGALLNLNKRKEIEVYDKKNVDAITQRMGRGLVLLGELITPESPFTEVHRLGTELTQGGRFEDASSVLLIMVILDPYNPGCWSCFGMAEERNERWQAAINAYSMAIALDGSNPLPYLRAQECYLALGKFKVER